ncbi:MAG TPA: hypothetical protein VNJ07_10880 [Chitinophagales bacterium]|nr:hypothetical protein [Chitinophagales bacterium]
MKNLTVIACLMFGAYILAFPNLPNSVSTKHIEGLDIQMQGEVLIASSDNPNDPLVKVEVFNGAGQKVAQGGCSSTKCTLDLSNLPTGNYLGKATSLRAVHTEPIYVP